ncbi:MAG: hypothetical protein HQK63_08125 [Desulfamplus sp.]|nr:hypothetical protein [Desulfamplus sp.]
MHYPTYSFKWLISFIVFICLACFANSVFASATGAISGTVYESDGTTPITGNIINVSLYKRDICNINNPITWQQSVTTNASYGTYTFTGISPGSYYILAEPYTTNHIKEWWAANASQQNQNNAQPLQINSGDNLTSINFQLNRGATLSGTLYLNDGVTPVTGTAYAVGIYLGASCSNSPLMTTNTNSSDGTFSFDKLPAGSYYISTKGQWWTATVGSYNCGDAQSISVASEQDITGNDFTLSQGAYISGTLYESNGSTPITGKNLYVQVIAGTPCLGYNIIAQTPINTTDGTYYISDLGPGQYYLRTTFYDTSANYANGWWASSGTSLPCGSAESITVVQGQTYSNKNFKLNQGAIISGTLFEADGTTPITGPQNIDVQLISGAPCASVTQVSNVAYFLNTSNGQYTFSGIPAGVYYLKTTNISYPGNYLYGWWVSSGTSLPCGSAESITVVQGQTYSKNFSLSRGGTISGTIYMADGTTPITNTSGQISIWSGSSCTPSHVKTVGINTSNGTYSVSGLLPGNYYIKAEPYNNYLSEWWASSGSSYNCANAEFVTVTDQDIFSNKNFQLDPTVTISGTLFGPDGVTPLTCDPAASVEVFSGDPCGNYQSIAGHIVDNQNGNYYISGIPVNTTVFLRAYSSTYQGYWWWASSWTSTVCNGAEYLTLTQGQNLTGKNFQIGSAAGSASIHGTIYNSDGITPITGTIIPIYVYSGSTCGSMTLVKSGYSTSSGTYSISGLSPGTYFLQTYSDAYTKEWWATPASSIECAGGQPITLIANDQVTGKNFQLEPYTSPSDNGGTTNPPVTPPDNGGTTNPPVTPPDNGGTTNPPVTPPDNKPTDITDIKDVSDVISDVNNATDANNAVESLTDDINVIKNDIPTSTTTPPSDALVEAINTTTQNIGTLVDVSLNLLQNGTISVEQALKPVELLTGIIELGAQVAAAGGAISIEQVAGSIESVEGIVAEVASQNATQEQMSNIAGNINNMLGNMPDIMEAVLITDDVMNILGSIKGLAGAGISSSIAGNNDPSQTVDTLGSIVVKGLEQASDTDVVLNTGRIVGGAGDIVNHSVNVLQTGTNQQTVVQNTLDQLQVEISEMFGQTASNIKDKPVLNSFAASSGGSVSLKDFSYVMDNASGLTTSMIKAKSVLGSKLSGSMQSLSRETLKNILPAFISKNRFAAISGDSDIQKLMSQYPQLLNEVVKIASVNLTSGMLITKDDMSEVIRKNDSLTAAEKTRLIKGLPELPAFDQDIIKSGSTSLSLVELLNKELENPEYQLPGTTVEVISSKGLSLMVMLKNEAKGIEIPLYIQDARVVSSIIPSGLHRMPEDTFILVRNGIAGIITPAPLDAVDTLLSADTLLNVENLFGSDKKEISDVKVSNSGNLAIKFKDGTKFSGSFGYGTSKEGEGEFDAGTSSFELQMTDPASEAYSVLVTYSNGTTQTLSPSIAAIEQLVKVLDTLAAGSYTLDKATGIFTVMGSRFKPSYLIEPIATSEQTWFKNNRDTNGIAWEIKDYNGDGAIDLKMWTSGILGIAEGKQVIYTVVQ